MIDEIQEEVFIIRKDGQILYTNKAGYEMLGDQEVSSFLNLVEKEYSETISFMIANAFAAIQ